MSTSEVAEFLTAAELATYLKVPLSTVYHWRATSSGPPAIRIGRLLRYRRAEVEAWVHAQEEATA